ENKQEHFIKNIKIKNFKCFKEFKAEGFGRVNLIGGKNNVGKTAFMEALFLNTAINKYLGSLTGALTSIEVHRDYSILNSDGGKEFILSCIKKYLNLSLSSNINAISIAYNKKLEIKLNEEMYTNKDLTPFLIDMDITYSSGFISASYIKDSQLRSLFDGVKKSRKKDKINKFIEMFDNNIEEYEIIDDTPTCFSKSQKNWNNLSEYGQGLKRYIAYVCGIWAQQKKYILIDEIENGIHYSNLDQLWEVILKTSKDANCQVFATTHSKECIESYARVAKRLKDEEIRFIELGRNKKDELDSVVMDSEMFQRFIALGNEVRGW
ncbi:MAG: AAA family ATPase, partial [Sulfurovum sp.]|nr:AAA family ATPase [Sulfurovum sp.]